MGDPFAAVPLMPLRVYHPDACKSNRSKTLTLCHDDPQGGEPPQRLRPSEQLAG